MKCKFDDGKRLPVLHFSVVNNFVSLGSPFGKIEYCLRWH